MANLIWKSGQWWNTLIFGSSYPETNLIYRAMKIVERVGMVLQVGVRKLLEHQTPNVVCSICSSHKIIPPRHSPLSNINYLSSFSGIFHDLPISTGFFPWIFPLKNPDLPMSLRGGSPGDRRSASGQTQPCLENGVPIPPIYLHIYHKLRFISGWWFGWHFLFSHILGCESSQLTFIFFRGVQTTNQI